MGQPDSLFRNKLSARLLIKRYSLIFCILLLTAISYSNVIDGAFQFDDYRTLMTNQHIREPSAIWDNDILSLLKSGSRPLTTLTFAINYRLSELEVRGYHVLNILLHLLMTVLLYYFIRKTLLMKRLRDTFHEKTEWMAIAVTGIFALHPLQTESVSYISQRSEILASIFYLLSVISLIRFCETRGWKSAVFLSAGILSFISGWCSKEIVLTVPAVFIIYMIFFYDKSYLKKAFVGIAPFIIIGIFLAESVISRSHDSPVLGFNVAQLGQPDFFYTEMRVLLTYLRLIFVPLKQNFDYNYPLYNSLSDINVFGSILFWCAVVILGFCTLMLKGKWKWHFRLSGFGALWFLAVLMTTSSLVPIRDLIFEHRVYLAIAGIILAAVTAADMLFQLLGLSYSKKSGSFTVLVITVLLAGTLSSLTYQRNYVWQSTFSLWLDAAKKSPGKPRPLNNLGNCYFLTGDYLTAREYYRDAIKRDPSYVIAFYNLSLTESVIKNNVKNRARLQRFRKSHYTARQPFSD